MMWYGTPFLTKNIKACHIYSQVLENNFSYIYKSQHCFKANNILLVYSVLIVKLKSDLTSHKFW